MMQNLMMAVVATSTSRQLMLRSGKTDRCSDVKGIQHHYYHVAFFGLAEEPCVASAQAVLGSDECSAWCVIIAWSVMIADLHGLS